MFFNYLRFVFDQLRQHVVRFLLTISGVAVGVGSLVFLASFIAVGLDVLRETSTNATGEDLLTVRDSWRLKRKYPNERRLSNEDYRNLSESKTLERVMFAPQYGPDNRNYSFEGRDGDAFVMGLGPSGFPTNRLRVAVGRPFLSSEYERFSKVAIVGSDLLEQHPRPWIGKSIRVEGVALLIVGVLERKPVMGPNRDWSWNNRIIIPASTYNLLFNVDKKPDAIVGKVSLFGSDFTLEQSVDAARVLTERVLMLVREHKNFRIPGSEDRDSNEDTIMLVIKVLMIMTTVFSLVVGGINIMNIMLVTVTERTREIGLRRAMGATRRDIIAQFLIESVLVTMTGAILGLLGGLLLIAVLSATLTRVFYPWPYHVEWWSVLLSMGLSVLIGGLFGLSPALKAARLDPVEALRYE